MYKLSFLQICIVESAMQNKTHTLDHQDHKHIVNWPTTVKSKLRTARDKLWIQLARQKMQLTVSELSFSRH